MIYFRSYLSISNLTQKALMKRILNNTLKYGIYIFAYLSLLVPLITASSLYFPYIVGKAHVFRLFVEIAFALYLLLVIRDRSYLPKKNILLWSITAFTAILGVATIFAESPYKAFWSNFERMEGYVMILHLFALFIAFASTLKSKNVWKYLFNTTLAVSLIVGVQAFGDHARGVERIFGALGNSSYLGIYALMHVFLAGFLFVNFFKNQNVNKKNVALSALGAVVVLLAWFFLVPGVKTLVLLAVLYGISLLVLNITEGMGQKFLSLAAFVYTSIILFNLSIMYETGTRGSLVGLAVALTLIVVLFAILEKGIKRKISIGILIALIAVISFFGIFKNEDFIKNNSLLYRFSSLITFDVKSVLANQGKDRVLLWGVALKGVQERPILGWGQDNFGYVFAKHYNPQMYAQEQWFDRTHDVFLDWLISGGILALLSYLSLFFAVLYMIWRRPRISVGEDEWNLSEKAVLTGFLIAYFVHNLFVFDNLSSYILFFLLLSYVAARYNAMKISNTSNQTPLLPSSAVQSVAGIVVIALCISCVYVVVYKPYMAGKHLIRALQSTNVVTSDGKKLTTNQAMVFSLEELQSALSYRSLGDTEIRERLSELGGNVVAKLAADNSSSAAALRKEFSNLIDSEYKKQFEQTPSDPRPFIFYGLYLQKIDQYERSEQYVKKAVSLSPTKQTFLFQKGTTLLALKKLDEAVATMKTAYELAPKNKDAKVLYGISLIYSKKFAEVEKLLAGDTTASTDNRILQAYMEVGKYDVVITSFKEKIAADPSAQNHVSLAGAYLKFGQSVNALKELQEAVSISAEFAPLGKYYIKLIKEGKNPLNEPSPTEAQLQEASKL